MRITDLLSKKIFQIYATRRLTRNTNEIRRRIRKERPNKTINDLEENLWHDIEKARTDFVPSHTKLLNKDNKPCTSDERPDMSTDYFEHTQWAIDNNRDTETSKARVPPRQANHQN